MIPLEQRLLAKVEKTESCWLWNGAKLKFGHGVIGIGNKKTILTHRASWIIHKGEIPKNLCVLHKCDVPNCINPEHLFLGTYADNNSDMHKKGRGGYGGIGGKGRLSVKAKLTSEQIEEIRAIEKRRGDTKHIAKRYSICTETVRRIRQGWGCYGHSHL